MEGVFENDDAGALCIGSRDFDRIFHRFGAAVDEQRFFRELAGSDFIHALGEADVSLVGRDLNTGVEEAVELIFDSGDDFVATVTHVETANASGEIEVAVAIDVFEPGVFGFRYVDGRAVGEAAGQGLGAARGERLGFRAGDGCA